MFIKRLFSYSILNILTTIKIWNVFCNNKVYWLNCVPLPKVRDIERMKMCFSVELNISFCQCTAGCHTVQEHGFWLKTYYGVLQHVRTECSVFEIAKTLFAPPAAFNVMMHSVYKLVCFHLSLCNLLSVIQN